MTSTSNPADRGAFRTTRWSLVRRARHDGDDDARAAFAELCALYWPPVHRYVRQRGHAEDDARDLTQAFFTSLIETGDFDGVDEERGRFRAWLLGCARHFLANEVARERALKRGGGHAVLRLDFDAAGRASLEPLDGATPEAEFERAWAVALLGRVLDELEREYRVAGRSELFAALRPTLQAGADSEPLSRIAERLGTTIGAVKMAAHRLRRRYGERLRQAVADTLESPDEVEAELAGLIAALSASRKILGSP